MIPPLMTLNEQKPEDRISVASLAVDTILRDILEAQGNSPVSTESRAPSPILPNCCY